MKAKKLVLFLVMSIAAIMFIGCGKKEAKEEKEKGEVLLKKKSMKGNLFV